MRLTGFWGLSAIVLVAIGVLLLTYVPGMVEKSIFERLVLRKDSETYEKFKNSPVVPTANIYFFNYTNHDKVLRGELPIVDQVGPYVYDEIHTTVNDVFNENGTLSFTPTKLMFFNRNLSVGDETDLVIMPNVPFFAGANKMRYEPQARRSAFSYHMKLTHINPFVKRSVEELLWGYPDELVSLKQLGAPADEIDNEPYFGFMRGTNGSENGGRFTIFTGQNSFDNYALIDNWNGITKLTYWKSDKCNSFRGSSDGTSFPLNLDKNQTLHLFNPGLCRTLPLVFQEEVTHDDINSYRFSPPKNLFDNAQQNPDNECFCPANETGTECGIQGIFNLSSCTLGAPLAISWPHFLYGDQQLIDSVEGLQPDPEKHSFYFDIEPILGKPIQVKARIQVNLVYRQIENMTQVAGIRDAIFPLFWSETEVDKLPEEILDKFRLVAMIPTIILTVSITLLVLTVFPLVAFLMGMRKRFVNSTEFNNGTPRFGAAGVTDYKNDTDETTV